VICRRYGSKKIEVEQAPLPQNRIETTNCFHITGVDLAGPFHLKNGKKVWTVLFTCAVYRSIHLDLVESLSTEAFIRSFERFISVRGRPNTIYSDNGTNFVGTVNLFKKLDIKEIEKECQVKMIQWIFNPPSAAWYGGFWERLVRSVKDLLKRILGRSHLTFDELRTCLAAVESTINSRSLTTVTEDQDDLIPLTPAMFLNPLSSTNFPEGEKINSRELQCRYKTIQLIKKNLQCRFRKEYLAQLVHHAKDRKTVIPQIGDIVLVGDDNNKRFYWPLGRILELFEGKDGNKRVAKVKTATGILTRPLQRLYPLEVPQSQDIHITPAVVKSAKKIKESRVKEQDGLEPKGGDKNIREDSSIRSKFGRKIIQPQRYGSWNN
jgi:uncharacterized protein DUF5641